jgi:hypothetical protein
MRDATGELADRFHFLHLPNLQLSSFPFSDGIGERRICVSELCCCLARMRDPNSKGTDCGYEAGDNGDGKQRYSTPGRRESRFQKVGLVPLKGSEVVAKGAHQCQALSLKHQLTSAVEISGAAQCNRTLSKTDALIDQGLRLCEKRYLLRVIGDEFSEFVDLAGKLSHAAGKRLDKPFIAGQYETSLSDFRILQQRPDGGDLVLNLEGVSHPVNLGYVPASEPNGESQNYSHAYGRSFRYLLLGYFRHSPAPPHIQ